MNTTRLIGHWSMDGARSDLHHGFCSAVDILAVLSGRANEPTARSEGADAGDLLVKAAGGDDWQPLLLGSA
jgi:hypothetical protein